MAESLPPEAQKLWDRYLVTEKSGGQKERMAALGEFLRELRSLPLERRKKWVFDVCRQAVDLGRSPRVRLPLFRDGLFPVLYEGLKSGEAGCARWMGALADDLWHCPDERRLLEEFGYSTKYELLKLALVHELEDQYAARILAKALYGWLDYATHEVPSGIMCDWQTMGVTEACGELRQELGEFEELVTGLGIGTDFNEFIEFCRFHLMHYPEYVRLAARFASGYPEYLASLPGTVPLRPVSCQWDVVMGL